MAKTFFFYDLETSGLSARDDRIMQFAGRRTDEDFNPIGEPYNLLVALNDDTIPSPEALMVTGISPQKTLDEGYTEAQFVKILTEEIFTPDTIVVGFNNVRFDDEFIRHLLWRNFYDPYEWSYKDGRSRWDMLDVVRMTRALRPDGINWPVDAEGKPTNRLELLTKENGIDHLSAHDALSDVDALIGVTKLLSEKQPQLLGYLLGIRGKREVQALVNLDDKKPFVYVSGRYDTAWQKATVALPIAPAPNSNVLVYDLRVDPTPFIAMSEAELAKIVFAKWEDRKKDGFIPLPVKTLQYNRCPAVAPLGVLGANDGWSRIGLTQEIIAERTSLLHKHPDFAEKLRNVYERKREFAPSTDPEAQLYDGFLNDRDRLRVETVRNATEHDLADFHPEFVDERLSPLLLHYKARNYPRTLSADERQLWENWRTERLHAQLPKVMASLDRLSRSADANEFMLQEIQLWIESIMPAED